MRYIIKGIALVSGLGIFAIVVLSVLLAINNRSPFQIALLGIAALALTPAGFELCRFAFQFGDKKYRFFSRGYRGVVFDILSMFLAICLTVATVNDQHPSLFCQGQLSAGFPVAFICDATGESPLSSVGQIDWADLDSVNLPGSFVDILFYISILWTAWRIVSWGRLTANRQAV